MKISTEIGSLSKLVGEERAVEYVARAGFDAWDFSMFNMCKIDKATGKALYPEHPLRSSDYLGFARELKKIGMENGIVCNQSHAPFPVHIPEVKDYLKRAIECTAEAGGEICVIHPDQTKGVKENAEMYMELLPFAKEHGVRIATENMWSWDYKLGHSVFASCATPKSFKEHLDAVNDEFLVACLDIGHSEMLGSDTSAPEMIRALGKRLKALHIHDNDKLNDSHQIPFSMKIDFHEVVRALSDVGYEGYFTLEAYSYLGGYNSENAFEGVKRLAGSAKRLSQMYEEIGND